MTKKLHRIAGKARQEKQFRFTSLYHLLKTELLERCHDKLRSRAASGIDGVTKETYDEDLAENLESLEQRLQAMSYQPQPVRRTYIPKPGTGKQRPLGIPAYEDKVVQAALVSVLEPIYEADFIEDSFGFRPKRGCHDALRALSRTVESGATNWIVEADIKGFFDNVDHDWLMKFLAHRIGDKRILRLIKRLLRAGVMEDGSFQVSEQGTPQGGVASPLLANVYLHYVLDLWFERRFRRTCQGSAKLIRYADDFVVCFQQESDAKQFMRELPERLAKFSLEIEPTKTKLLAFGPQALSHSKRMGWRKPETFDFLGFTHYCSKSRDGKRFRMKRVTSRKKLCQKLAVFKEWLKAVRSRTHSSGSKRTKLCGHYAYYGVTNHPGIALFAHARPMPTSEVARPSW
ncbi:MAG: group II intron reverse transcriptase/maturase [Pirellulaceae bacterium]